MKYTTRSLKILGTALLISLLSVAPAHATLITLNYNFAASGFAPVGAPVAAPFDPVTGSFSLTFDNSANINDSSLLIASISIPVTGSILFSYNSASDSLFIGGSLSGTTVVASGTNDFSFRINSVSTMPFPINFVYANDGSASTLWAGTNIVLTPAGSAVPETGASLGLLALSVTALGLIRRKLASV